MSADTIQILVAFICYLGIMIFIGLRYAKKNETSSDFFLGGRKVGPWMTALSAEASDMSAWLLMGFPGVAYASGMKGAFWTALGLLVGTYLNWLLVAKRLRMYSIHAKDSITLPEFFINRFKDKSRMIGLITTIIILVFFTVYAASGFSAVAKVFNSVYGIPYFWALVLGVAVILLYTILGGYLAVCATDFIQGMIMFFALVITVTVMVISLGGPVETYQQVAALGAEFITPFTDTGKSLSFLGILGDIAWGLGYFGMPHIIVRFMAIRSNKEIALSRRVAMIWVTIALIASVLVGIIGKIYLAPTVLEGANTESVFLVSIMKMFPAFIAGIFLCGIMAAAMSTADSQLLVASSAFSRDVFKSFIKKEASEKLTLMVSRLTVVAVAIIAFVIALDPNSSIFSLVSFAWAGFGASFAPIIILALFWKRTTLKGAITGLLVGGLTAVIWYLQSGGIFDVYEILPGFLAGIISAVIVSLIDKRNAEVEADFEAYKSLKD